MIAVALQPRLRKHNYRQILGPHTRRSKSQFGSPAGELHSVTATPATGLSEGTSASWRLSHLIVQGDTELSPRDLPSSNRDPWVLNGQ